MRSFGHIRALVLQDLFTFPTWRDRPHGCMLAVQPQVRLQRSRQQEAVMRYKRVLLSLLVGAGLLVGAAGSAFAWPPEPIDHYYPPSPIDGY